MKRILLFFLACIFFSRFPLITGCANIVPPTGGPRDTLAPVMVNALPAQKALHVTAKNIELNFDEYLDLKEIRKNLLVNPVPKIMPTVRSHLRTITIEMRDTLQPNTTYSFNFGRAIADVNEGNILKNFSYTFSTGAYIDSLSYSGRVVMAFSGKADSTLIVILHDNLEDSAVAKERPHYITRMDSSGNFIFQNIRPGTYALYAMEDQSGTHEYTTKAQIFAFADSPVNLTRHSIPLLLYAYADTSNSKSAAKKTLLPAPPKKEDKDKVKRLVLIANLSGGMLDLRQQFKISFGTPVKFVDTTKIRFTTDSFATITQYHIEVDSNMKKMTVFYNWKENTQYHLILQKDFAEDTLGERLLKIDTVTFQTKKEADYGNLRLRFKNLELDRHPVLLFIQNGNIIQSTPIGKSLRYNNKLFDPGEYDLRILYDTNQNGVWDPGDFWIHKQPEIVVPIKRKINVKSNWDNEVDITL